MSSIVEELQPRTGIDSKVQRPGAETAFVTPPVVKTPAQKLLAIPVGACIALAIHFFVPKREPVPPSHYYPILLFVMLGLGLLGAALYPFFEGLRKRMRHLCPLLGVVTMTAGIWELVTSCLGLLPLPYFPGPEGVFGSMVSDYKLLFDSTWHSLILLVSGYALGVMVALITGVTIGWFAHARYWGMPLLKVVGPIPATAWIPLAMVLSPSTLFSAIGLIALAVWFPVTMLTASGINNTRASYLDVARTLGAGQTYLIFRVAIPAALPNIFIGLFMGLGTSFLTLVVAENVGVKSGLGWYVSWAQGWAEYGKVYGALIIMAGFFSSIMTVLFKVRDRVLVWQKGVIKW
ncbi:MAG: ABC transporter permease [Verrucomicrobia bacterium]|nr:MAG: ABC transporter permease [Verrucomicrobiota bacterium]PYX03586.1 MAG: ABC transporter permease [Acidobacteriota bacterium]